MMTAEEFIKAGEAFQERITGKIWGWQSTIAHQIGKSGRTVRRYAAGSSKIPDDVAKKMGKLAGK